VIVPLEGSQRRRFFEGLGGVLVFFLAVSALATIAGPALAGDAIAEFEFAEDERSAAPGDTVEVEVWIGTDGGYADEGVESYAFVLAVPPSLGEPTAVEPGPWLAQGEGTVDQTVTDAGPGALRVRHERTGAADGVTGYDRAATVTIEVPADAPDARGTVVVADPQATLRGSDYRMRSFGDESTLVVGSGGERLDPAYEPAGGGGGSGDGVDVVTAAERNRSVDSDEDNESEAVPIPGIGLAIALGGVVAGLAIARWARRRD